MIKLLVYSFFLISLVMLLNKGRAFVYFVPMFNLITDMTFSFFEGFSEPTLIRGFALMLFILYFRSHLFRAGTFRILYIFIGYILLLLVSSEEFTYSLKAVSQVILSMLMLVVGYVYVKDYARFSRLMKSLFWLIFATILVTLIGYVFGIGKTLEYTSDEAYKGSPEFVGLLGSGGVYSAALVIGLLPFLLKYRFRPVKKWIFLLCSLILYVLILLNVRRTAILIPIIGIITYLLFTRSRLYSIKLVSISILLMIIAFPIYQSIFKERLEIREEEGRFEKDFYKSEDRYTENVLVLDQIALFKDPAEILFGVGHNIFAEHVSDGTIVRRMYHTDTAKLLYGTGIVGFLLYFSIYILIFIKILKIPSSGVLKDIKAGALALLVISIFVSLNGSLNLITFRSLNFLLIGSFLGIAQSIKNGSLLSLPKGI
jgi:hypothetical protein